MKLTSSVKTVLVAAAVLIVELIVVGRLIPSAGVHRNGAPPPILFLGLINGMIASLTAAGIVLVYRSVRIINFAQTAIGGAGFALVYDFLTLTAVPFPVALILGLAVAVGVGLAFDLIFARRFAKAPRLVLTVFTIVAGAFVAGTAKNIVDSLPFFPDKSQRTIAQLGGTESLAPHLPFAGFHFTLPGNPIRFGFVDIFALLLPLVTLLAISAFLRYSRLGVAIRALAENAERASLLGISVGLLSAVVWGLAGLLSGVGSTLNGMIGTPNASLGIAPELLVASLAAAVVARMRSIWIAVVASVAIGVLQESIQFLRPSLSPLTSGGLLVVIVVGLLLQSGRGERPESGSGTWDATEELRPMPTELARVSGLRVAKWVLVAALVLSTVAFPFFVGKGTIILGTVTALDALVALSLVVLTGWTGQVSLGQMGLAAVGAVIAGALAVKVGLPFLVVIPLATVVTAAVAAVIGLPALRLPGLYLAIATLAFAVAVQDVLFNTSVFGWLLTSAEIGRPKLAFLDFSDERSMYFLCLGVLAVALLLLRNLRASRFGRILIGLRDNTPNAQSAGITPLRTKLISFGIAGGLAGLAGALLAYQQRGVSPDPFAAQASIDIFVTSVIGGLGSLFGPVLGTVFTTAIPRWLNSVPELAAGLTPLIAIVILYVAPGGLLSVVAAARDSVLRIVAQRNRIIVPSLFADMDPEALHLRLVPLAAPSEVAGLSRIPRRYDLASLHADDRADESDRDAHALVAAARGASSEDGS